MVAPGGIETLLGESTLGRALCDSHTSNTITFYNVVL